MRRIDLFCKLVGPFAISVLDGISTKVAILATLLLNVTSAIIEYYAIAKVCTLAFFDILYVSTNLRSIKKFLP